MPWGLETHRRFQDRTTSPLGGRVQGTTPLGVGPKAHGPPHWGKDALEKARRVDIPPLFPK